LQCFKTRNDPGLRLCHLREGSITNQ